MAEVEVSLNRRSFIFVHVGTESMYASPASDERSRLANTPAKSKIKTEKAKCRLKSYGS